MNAWIDLERMAGGLLLWSSTAAALVVLGAGLNWLFRHWAASYRHSIWLAIAICVLAAPVVSNLVPGMLPRVSNEITVRGAEVTISNDSLSRRDALRQSDNNSALSTTDFAIPVLDVSPSNTEQTSPPTWRKPQSRTVRQSVVPFLYRCVAGVWIAGGLIYLLRVWWARKQLAKAFCRYHETTDESISNLVATLAREEGLLVVPRDTQGTQGTGARHIALTVTKSEVGPLIWGLMPARLLVPSSLSELPCESQAAAIRHEFAHVARGDEWVRRYLVLLRAVFWFHPMVRYCCDQVQLYAEKACDDHVLLLGYKPSEYSALLLKLGQKQSGMETAFVISGMAQSQITSRIMSILESNSSRSPMTWRGALAVAATMLVATGAVSALRPSPAVDRGNASQIATGDAGIPRLKVGVKDWPQWGGTSARNNSTTGQKIPLDWDIKSGRNVRWSMPLGSEAYGGVVVANGKVFAGANNGSGYIKRFPSEVDLGVLLCFNESDGEFLWQHSNPKLAAGRVHDWPFMGVCSAPLVDGDRLWYVNNRGEVVCLDTEGFWDGENDGPYLREGVADKKHGADVVWVFDMMKDLGVLQHNLANCSVTCAGDLLFVNTSNGVDEGHLNLGADHAPSFICLSRETGGVVWTDNSPGGNILHGQWSSPAYAVLGDVPQVIFGGGDGYLYGFLAHGENGNSKLLWKFDCNPKAAKYHLGGGATRNHIIATPVIYDGLVYVAVGEDPEHGEGNGHLWCIDPKKRGDVSPTLVFNNRSPDKPIAHKRFQALVEKDGDFEKPNPNSAEVWHYVGTPDVFHTAMHRSVSTVAIKNDLLFVPDTSGLFHCLDAKTGKQHWVHDLYAACWASPLIVDDRVYITDEDGEVAVFKLSSTMELIRETSLGSSIYTTPVVANDTLFITSRNRIWALQEGAKSAPVDK